MATECNERLRLLGKPHPKTCKVCGLGPCSVSLPPEPVAVLPVPIVMPTAAPEPNLHEDVAHYLWGVLDDIEDVNDMLKDGPKDDTAFRHMVMSLVEKRWDVAAIGEDMTLKFKAPPPPPEPS